MKVKHIFGLIHMEDDADHDQPNHTHLIRPKKEEVIDHML